jgi:hypothetical protein
MSLRGYCLPNWCKITNIEYDSKLYQVNPSLEDVWGSGGKYRHIPEPYDWMEVSCHPHAPTADIVGKRVPCTH